MAATAAPTSSTACRHRHRQPRNRRHRRAERRRQVDDAEGALRSHRGLAKAPSSSTAERSPTCPPERLVRWACRFVPQECNVFPTLSVEENLEMGAYIRRDDFRPLIDEVYGFFPPLQRQAPAAGRRAVRRPAPDGGDRPRLDDRAASCCCSTSPRPACRRSTWTRSSSASSPSTGRRRHPDGRAECAPGARHRPSRLRARRRPNRFTGSGADLLADPEVAKSFLGGGS